MFCLIALLHVGKHGLAADQVLDGLPGAVLALVGKTGARVADAIGRTILRSDAMEWRIYKYRTLFMNSISNRRMLVWGLQEFLPYFRKQFLARD